MRRLFAVTLLAAAAVATSCATRGKSPAEANERVVTPFSFYHVSDTHIGPYLEAPAELKGERSYATFRAMVDGHREPMRLAPYDLVAPPPEFIMHTGDVTEYGFPADTLAVSDRYRSQLSIPDHWVAGNHDHTWVSNPEYLRQTYGGVNFHFVHKGVHFIGLNSATLQEPAQSFGEEVVRFVSAKAAEIPTNEPVLVAFHHPPANDLWASEYDYARVLDLLRRHNVSVILVGHHHVAKHETWSNFDIVHGGSTFSKAQSASPIDGYAVANVDRDRIRIAYRYIANAEATLPLLDKALAPAQPPVRISGLAVGEGSAIDFSAWIDGEAVAATLTLDDGTTRSLALAGGEWRTSEPVDGLSDGRHWAKVTATHASGAFDELHESFTVNRPDGAILGWVRPLEGGVKSAPLLLDGTLYVGDNAGFVTAVAALDGAVVWSKAVGSEVLGTPAEVDASTIAVSTTAGKVLLLDRATGAVTRTLSPDRWTPLYTTPLVTADSIIAGGIDGRIVSWEKDSGQLRWVSATASYAVEQPPVAVDGLLVYTAWDGYMHAATADGGHGVWKSQSARVRSTASRYYAPADNRPIVVGKQIFLTDRGYEAGIFDLDSGEFQGPLLTGCTALALGEDGNSLLARRMDKGVSRLTLTGELMWESDVVAGRIPTPPVEKDGVVYTTGKKGSVHAVDGRTGGTLWSYQVTPQLYILAEPVVDSRAVYTVGLDGRLTSLLIPSR